MREKISVINRIKRGQINVKCVNRLIKSSVVLAVGWVVEVSSIAPASANGVQAELRSSAAILPQLPAGMALPTVPAGGVVIGAQPWVADASQGFTPVLDVETGFPDSLLALSTGGIHLPISLATVPATCG